MHTFSPLKKSFLEISGTHLPPQVTENDSQGFFSSKLWSESNKWRPGNFSLRSHAGLAGALVPRSRVSGTCKRGRQRGVSLICSENKSEQIANKTEQIGTNRGIRDSKEHKSEQIAECLLRPLLPTTDSLSLLLIQFRPKSCTEKSDRVPSRLFEVKCQLQRGM